MPRLGDDRDPVGAAVPRGRRDVMDVADAVRTCRTELQRAHALATVRQLDLLVWEEFEMPALLSDLRRFIDQLERNIRES